MMLDTLDCSTLRGSETSQVNEAIARGEDFIGYIPGKAFAFVLKNYRALAELRVLERNWFQAYLHAFPLRGRAALRAAEYF
jgi:hypothetical protein